MTKIPSTPPPSNPDRAGLEERLRVLHVLACDCRDPMCIVMVNIMSASVLGDELGYARGIEAAAAKCEWMAEQNRGMHDAATEASVLLGLAATLIRDLLVRAAANRTTEGE